VLINDNGRPVVTDRRRVIAPIVIAWFIDGPRNVVPGRRHVVGRRG
jgi:hypothetical protein